MSTLREFLIGRPLPTRMLHGERLDNFRALAALSPDALSSITYANDGQKAVLVLPEFIPAHWWENFLHNQTAWLIRLMTLYQRRRGSGRVIVEVPFHLRD